mmetsp:Transcript_65522/g.58802  ORF Transcript_65522/g.58802 Transcript_65522/m.58802 type:complete len:408 (-) Transcript_65522:120-1343(-)|eukprot:CAMPEP_0201566114 /NCGR_PEP_ID=MMETSP0190_2-20130828/5662_1 /ASSEMBLY_ACC=CAM_ASM_000263 /TAXON_ID=37353 /ORGANISM="Rosalina sp." /LENGTH=407 /DNA_ID=CAMNT_0047984383 /DNA_START=20 /DNA_END=1243 /DNA_ORIENTATION=-
MADQTALTDADDNIQTSLGVQYEAQKRKKYIYGGVALLLTLILIIVIIVATTSGSSSSGSSSVEYPIVVATWGRAAQADIAWAKMMETDTNYKSLDAVVAGVQWCQENCNQGKANVDSEGKVTQSAMVIFGKNMETGAVANLYDITDAVAVARDVLIYTDHAILVGEAATRFALQQDPTNAANYSQTTDAIEKYDNWKASNCERRFWRNVRNGQGCDLIDQVYEQDAESSVSDITGCDGNETGQIPPGFETESTDDNLQGLVTGSTAVLAIDENGEMSLATSSNGLNNKIAGRVSDAAIPGAGGYINPSIGGCTATGAGDIVIRFSPSKHAVTLMSEGYSPQEAAEKAVAEVAEWCGDQQLIVLCLSPSGEPGIAANEGTNPSYGYRTNKCEEAVVATPDQPRGTCV